MAPPSPHDAKVQAAWAAHRPYLLAVAAGMLKGRDDAEDVVQEACARLAASPGAIEDARGWLVVVIDDRLASGHHTISVPDHVFLPPRRSRPGCPRDHRAMWSQPSSLRFQAPIIRGQSTGLSPNRAVSRVRSASIAAESPSVVMPRARAAGRMLR